jgi:hypothetical protein
MLLRVNVRENQQKNAQIIQELRANMEYLVVLEVSQKQNYIFKTDKLKENIGASIIIRHITEDAAEGYLSTPFGEGRYWFAGGGKSIYIFEAEDAAKWFIGGVSKEVLMEYPGAELFMTYVSCDEKNDSIAEKVDELYVKLEKKKSERQNAFRLYGLGITEQCVSTQLPACEIVDGELCSREAAAKRNNADEKQDEVFKELLPDTSCYAFAKEFEELGGTKGIKDYLAVAVLDGNKLGRKIEGFRKRFEESFIRQHGSEITDYTEFNAKYKEEFAEFSKRTDDTWRGAMKRMIARLCENYEWLVKQKIIKRVVPKDNGEKNGKVAKTILPIRPLILAGDDICFVCDSRICLNLVEILLEEVERAGKNDVDGTTVPGEPGLHAAAGIAIVKNHYPFFRAHELAEQLCHSAKSVLESGTAERQCFEAKPVFEYEHAEKPSHDTETVVGGDSGKDGYIHRDVLREGGSIRQHEPEKDGFACSGDPERDESVLDFLIVEGEIAGSLTEIRKVKYRNSLMTNKPYFLHADGPDEKGRKNSLPFFKERFRHITSLSSGPIREYRNALFEGKKEADYYLTHKRLKEAVGDSFIRAERRDEEGNRIEADVCVDYDVIEMYDVYHDWE